jgi:vacuolar-type H+-ATPase subunit E/Vma4
MQSVIEKILDEAKREAESITRRYEEEIAKVRKEYEDRITQAEGGLRKEIEKKKQEEIMKAVAQMRLELNKRLTLEMQNHIEDVLQSAIRNLPEHKNYFNFLKELITESNVIDGELYLSPKDLKRFQNQLEKFLKQKGYNFTIKGDDKITGGVVIKRGKVTFLGSIDVIVETMREELKITIAQKLGFI